MKRFVVEVPATPDTAAVTGLQIKADDEAHVRRLIGAWLGEKAAASAIVRPEPCSLPDLLRRQVH